MRAEPLRVLVVCTANQCRSPMAAALAVQAFAHANIDAQVASAGVNALAGFPATESAEATLAKRGLDISEHESRGLDAAMVLEAHLIWCMERRHVVEIGATWPAAIPVTFTLLDLERRVEHAHRHPAESVREWLDRIAADRQVAHVLGDSDDDVADPIGRSLRQYRKTADRLDTAIGNIVVAMNAPLPSRR